MSFDYFYGQQSDLFTFYRVPKVLFTNERFWNISADAKMLYGSKCILQLRGVRPFLSDKYDLTQHPNYKYTSDFDKRNEFNIGAALLACAMCFGVFSTTAFAYVDESVATEEPAVEEKVPETEPEEPMLPLTPDGNLTLVDDAGSPTKSGKQFITAVTKNGNYFYIIIDRDDKGEETVHFLNQVDEADLLKLMDEEEVAEFTKPVEETKPEVVETVPEITEPTPEEKPKSTNMLPAILTLIVLACGGGFFVFKKVQEKKKAQEAAKPDPDADYVDDDEDYGYDPEFEDDDEDSSVDEDDNEPV